MTDAAALHAGTVDGLNTHFASVCLSKLFTNENLYTARAQHPWPMAWCCEQARGSFPRSSIASAR